MNKIVKKGSKLDEALKAQALEWLNQNIGAALKAASK